MIGIVQRWFQMPDALELPGMLRAVVPLMCARKTIVNELVTLGFWHAIRILQFLRAAARCTPGFATVVRALNDLPKPVAGLRGVDQIGVNHRTFHVINLPPREMRTADLPSFTRAIRSQNERAFFCADQNSDFAHYFLLFLFDLLLFSTIRALTSFLTKAAGKGSPVEKRIVPLLT